MVLLFLSFHCDFTVWTELIYITDFAVIILALVWMETARNGASLLMF
jgi:hypothetical protein